MFKKVFLLIILILLIWFLNSPQSLKTKNEIKPIVSPLVDKASVFIDNLDIPFKAAAEYLMDDHFVKLFQSETLLTLKDNYVLVEMSYINAPIQLYDIIFDLQVAGYKPVLAHPERYVFYHKNFSVTFTFE